MLIAKINEIKRILTKIKTDVQTWSEWMMCCFLGQSKNEALYHLERFSHPTDKDLQTHCPIWIMAPAGLDRYTIHI